MSETETQKETELIYPEWKHKTNILTIYYYLLDDFSTYYRGYIKSNQHIESKYHSFVVSLEELYIILITEIDEKEKKRIIELYEKTHKETLSLEEMREVVIEFSKLLKDLKITKLGFYTPSGFKKINERYGFGEDNG